MINIDKLEELSDKKLEQNIKFRTYLKNHADEKKLDKQFKQLHNKYFNIYKCSECRNCCKKIGTIIEKEELDNICKYMQFDEKKLIREELIKNELNYTFKDKKCMFLEENNNCKIEKCLPLSCREYPFTNKEERIFNLYSIIDNARICPVVFEILEELKIIYNFK